MAKTSIPAVSTPPTFRQPTQAEREAIEAAKASIVGRPTRAEVKLHGVSGGTLSLGQAHADGTGWNAQLTDVFGTSSRAFSSQALARVATAVKDGRGSGPTEEQTNAALALMGAIAPRDELEAAIGEQIIATHLASLDLLARARLNAGEYVGSAAAYTTMATKVSRTMATHVEALAKLRSGGKQTHEVRYVYVNGPAVFGDGTQAVFAGEGGGGFCGKAGQPHGRGAVPRLAPDAGLQVRGEESARLALSGPGDARQEAMRVPRRQEPRSADRAGERPLHVGPVDAGDAGGSPAHARRSAGRGGGR